MFDNLKCEVNLPIPESAEELSDVDWSEVDFQTKSLANALNFYVINTDRELHEKRSSDGGSLGFWDELDKDAKVIFVPCHYHGVIEFYTIIRKLNNDYYVTFKATFTHSKLEDLVLQEFTKEDNSNRLVKEAALKEEIKQIKNTRNTFWYPFYRYLYRRPIMWFGRKTRVFSQWLYSTSWKLERWLINL